MSDSSSETSNQATALKSNNISQNNNNNQSTLKANVNSESEKNTNLLIDSYQSSPEVENISQSIESSGRTKFNDNVVSDDHDLKLQTRETETLTGK